MHDYYTYAFKEGDTDSSIFSPGYNHGNVNANHSYDTAHINRVKTTEFTVTKRWEGDDGNVYGTRPTTPDADYAWESCFVIQRSTNGTIWEDVTNADDERLIVRVRGTADQESAFEEVTGLPVADADGKEYQYRAQELEPREDRYAGDLVKIEEGDRIDDQEGYYENAYTASYSNASKSNADQPGTSIPSNAAASTEVTNTLQTTEVQAQKIWRGNEKTKITLELQYLEAPDVQGQDPEWRSFAPKASVELDGTADVGLQKPYYENSGDDTWSAVWENVPLYMPGSFRGKSGDEPTQYRVVETFTGNGDFFQVDSTVASPSQASPSKDYLEFSFTNTTATSLTVTKKWAVPASFNNGNLPDVIAEIWRTTEKIEEDTEVPDLTSEHTERVAEDKIHTVEEPEYQLTVILTKESLKKTIEGLPKYDENGDAYTYFALERGIGIEGG